MKGPHHFLMIRKREEMNPKLYYIHDPMCSWCWGFRPVWDALQQALPNNITVEYVVGGLAEDTDIPMPLEQQQMIQNHWHTISTKLGTQFNFDFWKNNTPKRSTYPACRAVIAAKNLKAEQAMIDAIQRGYYLQALNPSEITDLTLIASDLAKTLATFDDEEFLRQLHSSQVQAELVAQIERARALTQRGFPSLVLAVDEQQHFIAHDYKDYRPTLAKINKLLV